MHLEIIDKNRIDLLAKLNEIEGIDKFILGGGTGLSLQYGFRSSIDFDFFCKDHFNIEILLKKIKDNFKENVEIINKEERLSTLTLSINKVNVSFFEYSVPTLKPLVQFEKFKNIKLFNIYDILGMKAIAIRQRGTKKDFFDFYCIVNTLHLNSDELIETLIKKYNDLNMVANFIYSITYFNDAENDDLPKTFIKYNWQKIKDFFIKFQVELKKYYDNNINKI